MDVHIFFDVYVPNMEVSSDSRSPLVCEMFPEHHNFGTGAVNGKESRTDFPSHS